MIMTIIRRTDPIWENLCLYCHDNEHARYVDAVPGAESRKSTQLTHKGLAGLSDLLKKDDPKNG